MTGARSVSSTFRDCTWLTAIRTFQLLVNSDDSILILIRILCEMLTPRLRQGVNGNFDPHSGRLVTAYIING
jgi:hypothetical protein